MQEEIRQAINEVLASRSVAADFVVEHPAELEHGDYASNVALVAAKSLGASPREIAESFRDELNDKLSMVKEITVAGPGFLNFHLTRDYFSAQIAAAIKAGQDWGTNNQYADKTILVEYTSPNLFKPLHIGNLVGNIVGESLTRLFEASGASVKRINYPSDIGLTVAKGVWGLTKTNGDPEDIMALGEAYRYGNHAYETDESAKAEIVAVNQALYAGTDESLTDLRTRGIATSKKRLAEICSRLGTRFDAEIPESSVGEVGVGVVKKHLGSVFTESDGAVVFEGERHGLHTRVFINSKGLPTYEAKDLGNFTRKSELFPDWDDSIIVTGNEQTEYFKVLYAAIKEVFPEANDRMLEHIATGFLTLTTGKMSSREGNVLTGESLLADMEEAAHKKAADARTDDLDRLVGEVAVAALKYQILKQSVGSNIVFDKQKALSFEGDSGPYLQYTHARIQSVLDKAAAAGILPSPEVVPEAPYQIERLIYQYPEVISEALNDRAPHKVVHYLTELAGAFNSFYAAEKIVDSNDAHAPYKAAVARAVQINLKNGLQVLGIAAPDQM